VADPDPVTPRDGLSVVILAPGEPRALEQLLARLEVSLQDLDWEATAVTGAEGEPAAAAGPRLRRITVADPSAAAAACAAALRAGRARHLAVVEARDPGAAEALGAMRARLVRDDLDLVVAGHGGRASPALRLVAGLARLGLGVRLHDPLSASFVVRRDVFDAASPALGARRAVLPLDLIAAAPRALRIAEVPVPGERPSPHLDALTALEIGDLLARRATRGLVPFRFALFAAIGLVGVGVHLASLAVFFRGAGLSFLAAQLAATLVAMTSNYALNNAVTYRDLRLRGRAFARGLLSFYGICAVGALLNLAVADRVFRLPAPWALAGLAGALVGSVWNYLITSLVTWRRSPSRPRTR
jgi:dolichol-phosphate mannosyltransferase